MVKKDTKEKVPTNEEDAGEGVPNEEEQEAQGTEATANAGMDTDASTSDSEGNDDIGQDLKDLLTDPQFPMVMQELRTIGSGLNLPSLKSVFLYMFMLVDTIASDEDLAHLVLIKSKSVDGMITPEEISGLASDGLQGGIIDGSQNGSPQGDGSQEERGSQLPSSEGLVEDKVVQGINSAKDGLIPAKPEEQDAPAEADNKSPENNVTIRTISVGKDDDSNKTETLADVIKRKKKIMGI